MSQEKQKSRSGSASKRHEVVGIVFALAAAIVLLSLASFSSDDPVFRDAGGKAQNWIGMLGAYLADGLLFLLGVSAFILVAVLGYGAAVAFTRGGVPLQARKLIGYGTLLTLGTAFCHIGFRNSELLGHAPGGLLGEVMGGLLLSTMSTVGSLALVVAGVLVALTQVSGFSLVQVGRAAGRGLRWVGLSLSTCLAWMGGQLLKGLAWLGRLLLKGLACLWAAIRREAGEFFRSLRKDKSTPNPAAGEPTLETEHRVEPMRPLLFAPAPGFAVPARGFLAPPISIPPEARREPVVALSEPPPPAVVEKVAEEGVRPVHRSFKDIRRLQEPEIVMPRPIDRADKEEREESKTKDETTPPPTPDYKDYRLPDLDLLQVGEQKEAVIEQDKLREYARRLEAKLLDYGIDGQVTKIMPGPVVTMYEYAPGPGIKVSRIAGLSNDLALALEAMSVRIVAPIPGRAVVGIEVANKERQTVFAREIIGHTSFTRARSKLTIALGKNIEGQPTVTDLNKMPHLLVAGATGTGKSVALNLMITSILFRNNPEDVRFIMVDPKVLELSLYEGIPHLLLPVVTDPRKASAALYWAVNEMERRIQVLHGAGVRDLDSYNRKVEKLRERRPSPSPSTPPEVLEQPAPVEPPPCLPAPAPVPLRAAGGKRKVIVLDATSGEPVSPPDPLALPAMSVPGPVPAESPAQTSPTQEASGEAPQAAIPAVPAAQLVSAVPETAEVEREDAVHVLPSQKLPHIIIVIDELADLMLTVGREVEISIARIAQKARAAGIHLIVATQRPSVNVITGLIKANLPARISFRVASKVDSRTILDGNGAETLLGNGDMLFHPPTTSEILRIHGGLITEEEITRVVEHLKKQAKPIYDESILASAEEPEEGAEGEGQDEDNDELYDQAVAIVAEMGQASTSMVQRKLRIGYNRAARLIERMEREGIVGPADGAKPREVLIHNQLP